MGKSNLDGFKKKHFAEAGWVFGHTFAEFLVSIGFWRRDLDDDLLYLQDLMQAWGNLAPAHHEKLLELHGLYLSSVPHNPWTRCDSIDWDQVHPRYKYMARGFHGYATLYQEKPVWDHGWTQASRPDLHTASANAFDSYIKGDCEAHESLVERPE